MAPSPAARHYAHKHVCKNVFRCVDARMYRYVHGHVYGHVCRHVYGHVSGHVYRHACVRRPVHGLLVGIELEKHARVDR